MIHSESRNTSTSEEAFWNHNWWRGNVRTARTWTRVQFWTFWFHLQKRWITFVTSTVKHGGEHVMVWRCYALQSPDNLLQTINIEILTNAASQIFDHPLASEVCYCTLRYETYSLFLCKTRFAKITFQKETQANTTLCFDYCQLGYYLSFLKRTWTELDFWSYVNCVSSKT